MSGFREMSRVELGGDDDPLGMGPLGGGSSTREESEWKGLTLEQELYLKKLLIKETIEDELNLFSTDPTINTVQEKTLFLRYLYQRWVDEMPLIEKDRDVVKAKLDQLLTQYGRFRTLFLKGVKDDRGRGGMFADIFDLAIVTPKEKRLKGDTSSKEATEFMANLSNRRETLELFQIVLREPIKKGNASPIYNTILGAKSMEAFDFVYRKLFGMIYVAPKIHFILKDPSKINKAKNIYDATPRGSLKTALTIANPMTLFKNLITLFVSRPLGAKNIIQRLVEESVEIKKYRNNLEKKKQTLNSPQIIEKVDAWVAQCYDPMATTFEQMEEENKSENAVNRLVSKVLADPVTNPTIAKEVIDEVLSKKEATNALNTYIHLAMRIKDKEAFVDMMGDDKFISPLQDVAQIVAPPVIEVVANAELQKLVPGIFHLIKGAIRVAEMNVESEKQRADEYIKELKIFEDMLLPSLQKVISEDKKGTLQDVIMWASEFCDESSRIEVDLQNLMASMKEEDKLVIMAEIDSWINFKKKERIAKENLQTVHLHPPSQTAIPKLLGKKFLEAVRPGLMKKMRPVK
eukprot:TRINITY_DN1205_c0_g1_i1.p2 TRINITY_DN1205_c0_g1~~TRINITY_DN1205_c0_g1_i1.p2  ORF type:complete len:575 (+),score=212.98 TRINITY_DN1205_c0_g1_i1:2430-4154(+)